MAKKLFTESVKACGKTYLQGKVYDIDDETAEVASKYIVDPPKSKPSEAEAEGEAKKKGNKGGK